MFEKLTQLTSVFRHAQEIGGKLEQLAEQMKRERVLGTAGGGMVEVEMTGTGEIVRMKIDPVLVQRGDVEMLEDLIPAAVNQAASKARQCYANAMKQLAEGMNLPIPGLQETLAKLMGPPSP
ncbi:MAG TPA: YbaB/EbfC family nucleoid-associated protein [Pirellulaceae bacterium]